MKVIRINPKLWSITVKLPITIALIVFSVVIAARAISVLQEFKAARASLEQNAVQLARSLALQNVDNVIRLDYWALYSSIRQQVSLIKAPQGSLIFGALLDPKGTVLTHTNPARQRIGEPLSIGAEVLSLFSMSDEGTIRYRELNGQEVLWAGTSLKIGGESLMTVLLAFDTSSIKQRLWEGGRRAAIVAFFLSIISGLIGWMISRRIVKPLGDLMTAVERMRKSDFLEADIIPIKERDEIGRLAKSFNAMTEELKEKKLLEDQVKIQEKLAAVGRMVSGVAHEINNPLGGMKNALKNLTLFGRSEEKRKKELRLLASGLNQIEHVVQALLAGHQRPPHIERCEPRTFDDLFLLIHPDCETREIHLKWNNALKRPINAPCHNIQQVLINLLTNAVHATHSGGYISFRAWEDSGKLAFEVEDTGDGMSQEQLGNIFEPFFTTKPDGVGLGLWMSMRLIDAMKGEISVESELGVGTKFQIIIPVDETGFERGPS